MQLLRHLRGEGDTRVLCQGVGQRLHWLRNIPFDTQQRHEASGQINGMDTLPVTLGQHQVITLPAIPGHSGLFTGMALRVKHNGALADASAKGVIQVFCPGGVAAIAPAQGVAVLASVNFFF